MKESDYTLAQDLTRARIARDIIREISAPSKELSRIMTDLQKLIDRGYAKLGDLDQ